MEEDGTLAGRLRECEEEEEIDFPPPLRRPESQEFLQVNGNGGREGREGERGKRGGRGRREGGQEMREGGRTRGQERREGRNGGKGEREGG